MKKLVPPPLALFLALFALAACATAEGYRQRTAHYVGAPADALLLDWGPPVDKSAMSDGRELWTYYDEEEYTTGGYSRQVPEERIVRFRNHEGEILTRTETYYRTIYEPPVYHLSRCETRFVISPRGRVETFSFDGDGCVATELS